MILVFIVVYLVLLKMIMLKRGEISLCLKELGKMRRGKIKLEIKLVFLLYVIYYIYML